MSLAIRTAAVAAALSALVGAAAQSDATTALAPATAETASPPTSSSDGGETDRPFTDARGTTVTLPAHPERVLALSEPTLDGAVALGVVPIGTSSGRGQTGASSYIANYGDGSAADIPIVAALAAPNLEMIAAADPDLILIDGTSVNDEALIASLGDIAPTVWLSAPGDDWKTAFGALGEALGRADQAAEVLADYEQRVADVASRLGPNAGATVSIVRWGTTGPALILQELLPSRVVADVGLARPPAQSRDGLGHSEPISLERIDLIDADWMFFATLSTISGPVSDDVGVTASEEALAEAVEAPGFTALAAYQNDHIVPVDGSSWTSAGGPIAANLVLDDIDAALTDSSDVAEPAEPAESAVPSGPIQSTGRPEPADIAADDRCLTEIPAAAADSSTASDSASTPAPPPDSPNGRSISLLASEVEPGGTICFAGSGYLADAGWGQTVTVKLDDADILGQFDADDDGNLTGQITLPAELIAGETHWLRFLAGAGKENDLPPSTVVVSFHVVDTAVAGAE